MSLLQYRRAVTEMDTRQMESEITSLQSSSADRHEVAVRMAIVKDVMNKIMV